MNSSVKFNIPDLTIFRNWSIFNLFNCCTLVLRVIISLIILYLKFKIFHIMNPHKSLYLFFLVIPYLFQCAALSSQEWQEIAVRESSDYQFNERYGCSVSISGDYAIVGARSDAEDENGANPVQNAGSAFILFRNSGGTNEWGEQKKIVAGDRAENRYFGESVSISGDYAIASTSQHRAYVFYRNRGGHK